MEQYFPHSHLTLPLNPQELSNPDQNKGLRRPAALEQNGVKFPFRL